MVAAPDIPEVSQTATVPHQAGGQSGFMIPGSLDPNLPFFGGGLPPASGLRGGQFQASGNGTFIPIDPARLENLAVQADITAEANAKAAWAARYPLLAAADKYDINSAWMNTAGQEDPFIHSALDQAGLGGYHFQGNPYLQARNMGTAILSKEQRDRNYNARMFQEHPINQLGLGPEDIANIAAWNTGGANAFNQGVAAQNLQNYITSEQQNSQLTASLLGSFGALGGAALSRFNYGQPTPNPQLGSSFYYFGAPSYIPADSLGG